MADGPISSRNALTATGVTDPPDIRIGIDNLQGATPASNQMSLPELGKAIGAVINKDTVAEMLALTGVPDGTRVDTARYSTSHAVGDGSGGEYVYDADSTATIDLISVFPGIAGVMSVDGNGDFDGTEGTGRWIANRASQYVMPSTRITTSGVLDFRGHLGQSAVIYPDGDSDLTIKPAKPGSYTIASRYWHGLTFNKIAGDYVEIGDIADFEFPIGGAFSISAFFRADTATLARNVIVAKRWGEFAGWSLDVNTSGAIRFQYILANSAVSFLSANTVETGYADGEWHHVLVTHSGSGTTAGTKFYVDGVLKTTTGSPNTLTSGDPATVSVLYIGSQTSTLYPFDGEIKNIMVWNANELTAEDAVALNNYRSASVGPFAWWKLDEGTGTSVVDYGSGGNDGTVNQCTWNTIQYSLTSPQVNGSLTTNATGDSVNKLQFIDSQLFGE